MWRYYFQINWLFLIGLKVLLSRCDLEIYLQRNSHSRCHRSCCYIMCKHGAALPIVVLFSGTTKIYVVSMVALWLCYVQCHGNIYCSTKKRIIWQIFCDLHHKNSNQCIFSVLVTPVFSTLPSAPPNATQATSQNYTTTPFGNTYQFTNTSQFSNPLPNCSANETCKFLIYLSVMLLLAASILIWKFD